MKLISICIPVYNEEKNIKNTYEKITKIIKKDLKEYQYEIIFTDNHSSDKSFKIIQEICQVDSNVKLVRFNRNIGYDRSLLEGYRNSSGHAVISIDCDLQDPPELIFEFIKKWEEGYDLVYGIRKKRKENRIILLFRRIFYNLINTYSEEKYPKDVGDFKLIDKSIINILSNINEPFPYVRGLVYSNSKNNVGIDYHRNARIHGESKYNFFPATKYALNAILENSYLFNSFFRYLSIIIFFVSSINLILEIFKTGENIAIFFLIFLLSLGLIFLSIIFEYISRIYSFLKRKNSFFYENKINL